MNDPQKKLKEYNKAGHSIGPLDRTLADAYAKHGGPLQAWAHFGKGVARKAGKKVKRGAKNIKNSIMDKLSRNKKDEK